MRQATKEAVSAPAPDQSDDVTSISDAAAVANREPSSSQLRRRVRATSRRARERRLSSLRPAARLAAADSSASSPASGGSASEPSGSGIASAEAGTVLGGKYRLERCVARGGMGSVWVAEHLQLRVRVAIKLMSASSVSSASLRARFEREARATARIDSPHVVTVQDFGVEGEVPYMVMELLEGEDLAARLRRVGRMGLTESAAIVAQIAKGLACAHAAGIVVCKDLTADAPTGDEATCAELLLGSPSFMSPEQIRSAARCDHRTDVWSLGVVLFRMLTGGRPFHGETPGDLLVRICTEPTPSARALAPELPRWVDFFFERALARDAEDRFASVTALEQVLTGGCELEARKASSPPVAPLAVESDEEDDITLLWDPPPRPSTLCGVGSQAPASADRFFKCVVA